MQPPSSLASSIRAAWRRRSRAGSRHPVATFLAWTAIATMLAFLAQPTQAQYAPREQTRLDLAIAAADDVNPDDKGRAAPILVRIYELKSPNGFENADYFSLKNDDKAVLHADVLVRDEFILRPGDTRAIRRKSHPEIGAIGVIAGYRDLAHATWRAVHVLAPAPEAAWYRAVVPSPRLEMQIRLEPQGVRLAPVE